MPKRSAEDVWRQLVDEAGEDAIERAASVSVAQAEKELAKAGFDVAAERAKADALMRELEASVSGKVAIAVPAHEPPMALVTHVPKPQHKARQWSPALVATTTLVVGAAIVILLTVILPRIRHDEITADQTEASTSSPKERAVALRRHATDACRDHRWNDCRQALDDAQALDPAGEQTPEVRTLRNTIHESIPPTPLPNPPQSHPDIKDMNPGTK
jgi:hypothetical protein